MQSTEVWAAVSGYEGRYEVSDRGRVRSLDREVRSSFGATRVVRGVLLRPSMDDSGHLTVGLYADNRPVRVRVHRIVAKAFVPGEAPGLEVCHNDGNPANNHAANLRWGTRSDNTFDRVRHGTHHEANKTHCPKGHEYTPENIRRIPSRPNARYCRECQRIAGAEYMRRKRAAGRNN